MIEFIKHRIWDKDVGNLEDRMAVLEELAYGFVISRKGGIYPFYIREKFAESL